jgi:hypothetical protein
MKCSLITFKSAFKLEVMEKAVGLIQAADDLVVVNIFLFGTRPAYANSACLISWQKPMAGRNS